MVTPNIQNPSDQTSVPATPGQVQPQVGPPVPENYVSPQQAQLKQMAVTSAAPTAKNLQQAATISTALKGAGFKPAAQPTQKVGEYTYAPSPEQARIDYRVMVEAGRKQKPMGEGAWVKKNGQWRFVEKYSDSFLGGVNPDSMASLESGMLTTQQIGGIFAGDISKLVKTPFHYMRVYGGSQIAKGSSKAVDSIPFTEWAENAVGSGLNYGAKYGSMAWNFAVRDNIRRTMEVAMTPLQMIENITMFLPAVIDNTDNRYVTASDASIWDQIRGLVTNTTLFQSAISKEQDPTGKGYFPSGTAEEERNKLEERLRPKFFGQTATVGRTIAGLGVVAGLYEPGDDIHSLLSGATDAYFVASMDPVNLLFPAHKGAAAISTFAKTPTEVASAKALIKAGIALTPETLADADRVLSMVDEAGKLSEHAVSLVTPQPGTYWSGDRFGALNGPIETFNNLGPNGPVRPNNLFGSAFYASDSSPLGTSYMFAETGEEIAKDVLKIGEKTEVIIPAKEDLSGIVYEIRIPETGFNVINGEGVWTLDPKVPWNLNNAISELGFTRENLDVIKQLLSDNGIIADLKTGSIADELDDLIQQTGVYEGRMGINPVVPVARDAAPEMMKIKRAREFLASPQGFLDSAFKFKGDSPMFTNNAIDSVTKFLDEVLLDDKFFVPSRGYRTFTDEYGKIVSESTNQSTRGKLVELALDDPTRSGGSYFKPPIQTLEDHIYHLQGVLSADYVQEGTEAANFILKQVDETNNLIEKFAIASKKIVQETPASSVGTRAIDKELVTEGIQELKLATSEYSKFVENSREEFFKINKNRFADRLIPLENSSFGGIAYDYMGQTDPVSYFISKLTESLRSNQFDETVFKGLNTKINLGDVGPFKNLNLTRDYRSGVTSIIPEAHLVPGVDNPSGVDTINHWLQSKGVDAIKYDGGTRVGGYGNHEALAVFAAEKLGIVSRTGERLPVTEAKMAIERGKELALSADDIAAARGYKDSLGLIEGSKASADPNQYNKWKVSGYGKNTMQSIAENGDAYEIWRTWLKGRSPILAQKLASATTAEEVQKIFDFAVMSPDPFEHLYQLPGWSGNVVGEVGYRTKQAISKNSRLAATLPRSTTLPLDDFEAGARNLHDTLILLKTPFGPRTDLMNEYFKIVAQDDFSKIRGDLFDFAGRFKTETVREKIQPVIDKLREPLKKTYEEMTPFERITMKRRTEIAQEVEDFVRRNESWTNVDNQLTKYTIDDVARGVPLDWVDGNGLGPLYPSQQNQTAISLIPFDSKELDEMIRLTSNWAELSTMARTLPAMGRTVEALDKAKNGAFWLQTVWKKNVLFSGRYIARVVPEEMMRVSLSGQFSNDFGYVSELLSGRLNKDVYGRMMPYIGEADDIALKLDEAEVLATRIDRAKTLGDAKKVAKLERRLNNIDTVELESRLTEVEAILEKEGASVRDVMIGPVPDKAADTVLGNSVPKFIRAGVQQTVFKPENPRLWLKGVAQAVIERSANPAASVVARAVIDGSPSSLEYVAKQMYEGGYRSFFESYFKAEGRLKPSFDWDTLDGARKYVQTISEDLQQVTGGHPHLLHAIADGEMVFSGESFALGRRTAEGNIPSSDFLRILNQGDLADPSIPAFAGWDKAPEATTVYPSVGTFSKDKSQGIFSLFMQHAYGRSSDKFARVPLWNARKWNLVSDMIPMLSKEEATKLATEIHGYGLPAHVIENVADNIPRARGTATLAQVEELAGRQATEDTINLLFDSRKRTLFGRNHRLLFPFFDAFREVGVQMIKTAIDPRKVHRIDKAAEALTNLQVGGPGETNLVGPGDMNQDGKNEGFVYKDPQTNQMTFNLPLVGGAARALTGIPFDYKVSVGSLSMATSVIPSVGPYVSLAYSAIPNRQSQAWDTLNKLVIPFGDPSEELQSYFTPLAIRRFAQGMAAGTPFERVAFFMGNPNNDPVYKTLQSRTLMAELASGKYPQDEAGVREAMQVSQDKGNTLWWLRGLTQFFSPAAPISQFYAKKDEKLVPLGVLLDSVRKTENNVRAKGGTYQDQIDAVVNQYGDFILPYMASLSQSTVPGAESSKSFYDFKSKNTTLFNSYPEIAGYFGPNTNEFDQEIYNIQKRSGELKALPPEEVAKQIEQLWGNFRYNKFDRELTQALGESPLKSYALSLGEQQIKSSLPSWDRNLAFSEYSNKINNAVNSVIRISNDEKFAQFPAIPPLKKYLTTRNEIINVVTRSSGLTNVNSWKNNRGGIIEREALKLAGENLAKQYPEFKPLWDNVLSREFKTLTEQEMTLAKTGQLP